MTPPAISVIIPTYNRAATIGRAIDSVFSQTRRDFEVVVVDDGSTDETKNVLASYSDKIVAIAQKNAGPAAARNAGIAAAQGDWLAFLDSDDIWLPAKLERQLAETEQSDADLSFHDVSVRYSDGRPGIASWNAFVNASDLKRAPLNTGLLADAFERMMTTGHLFYTTTFMAKRRALASMGGFRPELRTSEDLELYFRLAVRYRVAFIAEPLGIYSPGSGRIEDREKIYLDRMKAIQFSIADCLGLNDAAKARSAKAGLLQQTRSLAGEYRRKGRPMDSAVMYSKCLRLWFASLRRLSSIGITEQTISS